MAKDIPDVSIIIPLFNCADLFPTCIESLLEQTFDNIEVIVVDDGSNDGSDSVADRYAANDPRVRVLRQHHKGAGAARNLGIDHACGEFLMFLDADDFFEPYLVEKALCRIREADADICVFGAWSYNHMTGDNLIKRNVCRLDRCPSDVFAPRDNAAFIFTFTTAAPWTKMYRTSFVRENGLRFQELPNSNDLAFTMTANAVASRIAILDEPLVHYRINRSTSTQGSKSRDPIAFYKALLKLKTNLDERALTKMFGTSFRDLAVENCLFNLRTLKSDQKALQIARSTLADGGMEMLGIEALSKSDLPTCNSARWKNYKELDAKHGHRERSDRTLASKCANAIRKLAVSTKAKLKHTTSK